MTYSGMKTCSKCGVEKLESEFGRHGKTLRGECKKCKNARQCAYMVGYRLKNPGRAATATRKSRERTPEKKVLRSLQRKEYRKEASRQKSDAVRLLKSQPCQDCGGVFPAIVMDFDHRNPEEKENNVSFLVTTSGISMDKVLLEIAKCDLVCANCHRIRTFERIRAKDCVVCETFGELDFQI